MIRSEPACENAKLRPPALTSLTKELFYKSTAAPQPEPPPPPPPGGCPAIGLGGHRAPSCLSLALLLLYAAALPLLVLLARRLRAQAAAGPEVSAQGWANGARPPGGLLGRLLARLRALAAGRAGVGEAAVWGRAEEAEGGGGMEEPLLGPRKGLRDGEEGLGSVGFVANGKAEGGWDGGVYEADGEASDEDFPWVERQLRRWFRKQARPIAELGCGGPPVGFRVVLSCKPRSPMCSCYLLLHAVNSSGSCKTASLESSAWPSAHNYRKC